ncbi:MAG TPA: hypothetical protein VNA17_00555 [Pyrinomonadaceae bacterium]|nr:hypothetical protein [Pyrinomonadaceae bacterium]
MLRTIQISACLVLGIANGSAYLTLAQTPPDKARILVSDNKTIDTGNSSSPLVEPQLVAHPTNPKHLLGGFIIASRQPFADTQDCAAIVSFDGGQTWSVHAFRLKRCGDPWVALRGDGQAVFTALAGTEGQVAYQSADGGRTWSSEPISFGRGTDHPTLTVDRTNGKFAGSFYMLTNRSARTKSGNVTFPIVLSRSSDGGKTFSKPNLFLPSNLNMNPLTPAVLSDGSVAVAFIDLRRSGDHGSEGGRLERRRAWMLLSEDGGLSFSPPMFISEQCGSGRGFPSMIVDNGSPKFRDRLYFLCISSEADIVLVHHSADRGEKWSEAVRVNSGTEANPSRRTPSIAVNKDGLVGVTWYDRRNDPDRKCQDIYFSASLDGGRTFLPEVRVSDSRSCPDTPKNGETAKRWSGGGDYSGLAAASDGKFHVLWADSRSGVYQLMTAQVDVKVSSAN